MKYFQINFRLSPCKTYEKLISDQFLSALMGLYDLDLCPSSHNSVLDYWSVVLLNRLGKYTAT